MSFPDTKYNSIADYFDDYTMHYINGARSLDRNKLKEAADLLIETFKRERYIFACGNGGSAAISNHLLCDFVKGIQTDTNLFPKVISLCAHTELILAISNDIEFEEIFKYQLRSLVRPGDVLMTISASGDSENIVRAEEWAKENNIKSIALTGFSGGRSAELATINLHVASDNYGVIEDIHQSIMHSLAHYIRQTLMSTELICNRKF